MEQRITINGHDRLPDRTTVRFAIPANEIREAAETRAEHHRQRQEFWQEQKEEAETELQGSLQLRPRQVSGGNKMQAVFDHEKQDRVLECHEKVREHIKKAEGYEAWVKALNFKRGQSLELSIDDVEYFGLGLAD